MKSPAVLCTIAALHLGLLIVSANVASPLGEVTPIGKVVELLDVLLRQVEEDGVADGKAYIEYADYFRGESFTAKRLIKATTSKISALQADIEEEEAFRSKESARHDKVAGEMAKAEKDLHDGQVWKNVADKHFEETEGTLENAVDSLQRSLNVLGKSAPAAAASAASLVSVAENLKTVLLQGGLVHLSAVQKDTLDGFLHAVRRGEVPAAAENAHRTGAQQALAPDFLQVRSRGSSDSQAGDVSDTLQSLLAKSQEQLDDSRRAAVESNRVFSVYSGATRRSIDNKQKTISEIKNQLSQSQQKQSGMEAELQSEKDVLKVTQKDLAELEASYLTKTAAFNERATARSDEILAVREASQLLTSPAADALLGASASSAMMFLQLSHGSRRKAMKALQATRRKANFVLEHATMPGLALLAIRMHTNAHGSRQHADPFGKVKTMVRDMLNRLQAQAAQEATQKGFCDSEMSKSTTSKNTKEEYVQKLKDRLAAMDADIEQLKIDISDTREDLANMQAAVAQATKVRGAEEAKNIASIQQYKDSVELVTTAMDVLKKFYEKAEAEAASEGGKKKSGLGSGVIGILEIAVQDFKDLLKETEMAEATASQQFQELQQESQVKTAVFTKDLEYRSRDKVKTTTERMMATNDLKNFDKELGAVEAYLASLKAQCIAKAEPYAERKAKREAELASLKEALDFLKGDGMAP